MRRVRFTLTRLFAATAVIAASLVITPIADGIFEILVCVGLFSGCFLGIFVQGWKGGFIGAFIGFTVPVGCMVLLPTQYVRGSAMPPCRQNLRLIGLAIHNYHAEYGRFPPAVVRADDGGAMHSWRVLIAPYLQRSLESTAEGYKKRRFSHGFRKAYSFLSSERTARQKALQLKQFLAEYDFAEPWNGPNNRKLIQQQADIFRCPDGRTANAAFTSYVSVVGDETAWPTSKCTRMDSLKDGSSNTILVVEIVRSDIPWMEPRDLLWEDARFPTGSYERNRIGNPFLQGINALFADGSVSHLPNSTSGGTLKALYTINGGENISALDF